MFSKKQRIMIRSEYQRTSGFSFYHMLHTGARASRKEFGSWATHALEDLPRPARIPKIGLRGRITIVFVGFGIFWGAGLIESNFFARGQTTIVCTDVTCSALVVIAAVGFWMAIIGGISIVVWIFRRFL